MRSLQLLCSALVATSFLAPAPAAQVLHVVDGTGLGDFGTIQEAVDAASDGDQILVRAGAYGAFTIQGKGLVVHGDEGGRPARR